MTITIDGPSGTGKSTVAKAVAEKLGLLYYDTGAMYRVVAYGVLHCEIDWENPDLLAQFLDAFSFEIRVIKGVSHYLYRGKNVSSKIRDPQIAQFASKLSTLPKVREKMVTLQREFGKKGRAVFEGRDMGSVVFPDAKLKVFMTASAAVRAKRRHEECLAKDQTVCFEEIYSAIKERDERDETRKHSPLRCPEGALAIDTSDLRIDQVVEKIIHAFSFSQST